MSRRNVHKLAPSPEKKTVLKIGICTVGMANRAKSSFCIFNKPSLFFLILKWQTLAIVNTTTIVIVREPPISPTTPFFAPLSHQDSHIKSMLTARKKNSMLTRHEFDRESNRQSLVKSQSMNYVFVLLHSPFLYIFCKIPINILWWVDAVAWTVTKLWARCTVIFCIKVIVSAIRVKSQHSSTQ